jgi:hypothetical protein
MATLICLCAWQLGANFQVVPANNKWIFILHHKCLAACLLAAALIIMVPHFPALDSRGVPSQPHVPLTILLSTPIQ